MGRKNGNDIIVQLPVPKGRLFRVSSRIVSHSENVSEIGQRQLDLPLAMHLGSCAGASASNARSREPAGTWAGRRVKPAGNLGALDRVNP
jgi:hypothetical protein